MNARMPELKRAFEDAGFGAVRTLLSSGNVVFDARAASLATLERKAQEAMAARLPQAFAAFVRPVEALQELLDGDPYAGFRLPAAAKRVVTFLHAPPKKIPALPVVLEEARILHVEGTEVLSAYVPGPRGPVFMTLIEKTFGKDVTTRTWDTIRKVAGA